MAVSFMGLRNLQWKLFPLYPTLKAYLQLSLRQSGFLCDVLEFLQAGVSHTGGQLLLGLPAAWHWQIPVSGKKDDFFICI